MDERLAEMEADHVAGQHGTCAGCNYDVTWPCDAVDLIAEVRRLQRALHLSELSRGVPGAVGQG